MLKYGYFPTGRRVWFDVAAELALREIAQPCIWLGGTNHYKEAQRLFCDCIFPPYESLRYSQVPDSICYTGNRIDILARDEILFIKDKCLKMFDRIDYFGNYRRIDREAHFHHLCLASLSYIEMAKPDVFVAVTSPHSVVQFIMFEMCKIMAIPTYSFGAWSIAPVVYLREHIDGLRFERGSEIGTTDSDALVEAIISIYLNKFSGNYADFEPSYLKIKKRAALEASHVSFKRRVIRVAQAVKSMASSKLRQSKDAPVSGRETFVRSLDFSNKVRVPSKEIFAHGVRSKLLSGIDAIKRQIPNEDFAYFALHYEPERTTNPDGGRFHDQFTTLAQLRALIPSQMPIVVREHPSQLNSTTNGFSGRSPFIYKAIASINNVIFVDHDVSPESLLRRAVVTATVAGTSALEAALLGRKGLIFGHTWFEGAPNVFRHHNELEFETITSSPTASRIEIKEWLINSYRKSGFPGILNPSGERHQRDLLHRADFRNDELQCALVQLRNVFEAFQVRALPRENDGISKSRDETA